MPLYDRAAQFAAFDALAGFSDMISEEQRETGKKLELGETELEKLNQKLNLIADVIADGTNPTVSITYFVPDAHKAGGSYVTITDAVKRVDTVNRKVVLMSTKGRGRVNNTIDFSAISGISGELVDYLDDVLLE
ncbi:MAG: hypothetical protein IJV04_02940 [Lachnospiraceae bacterium]|nr:hypothetical protein [Lachnospiraceae bacterium]